MTNDRSDRYTKSYRTHDKVYEIMRDLLQYDDDLEFGETVSKNHKRYLDKEKVELLHKHIFPSMANVVFFFRFISRYPRLKKYFENDIKDLLGVRRENPQVDECGFIFSALVKSIILPGVGFVSPSEIGGKDFRLRLNQSLQEIVKAKADLSLKDVFRSTSAQRIVSEDYTRAWAWTRMLTESVKSDAEDKKSPRRTIRFGIMELREDDEPL